MSSQDNIIGLSLGVGAMVGVSVCWLGVAVLGGPYVFGVGGFLAGFIVAAIALRRMFRNG